MKNYYLEIINAQHEAVRENIEKREVHRSRNRYITDTITSVDIQENATIGGFLIEIYEEVFCEEIFERLNFRRIIGKIFFMRKFENLKEM